MQSAKKKIKSYRFGILSEYLVIWFLRLQGYTITDRRCRTRLGEIDLIARRGKTLAFIEVKARKNQENELVHLRQQQRISRSASLLIAKRKEFANLKARFDVVIVRPWKIPKHIKNAWEYNG